MDGMSEQDKADKSGSSSSGVSRRRMLATASAAGVAAFAGCAGSNENNNDNGEGGDTGTTVGDAGDKARQETVKIGALYPLSGNLAQLGQESFRGVELAVAERNSNGGLNGNQIEIVQKDAPDADSGVSAVESLATVENVPVVVGSYSSTISRAATQKAATYQLPYWELGAVADEITEDGPPNVFRTNPKASFFGRSGVENAANVVAPALDKDPGELNVAVMYESGAYGNSVADSVKSRSEEKGMNIVADIEYDASTSDLSSAIQTLKNAEVDVLNHTGYSSDIYLLWNQSEQLDNYIPAAIGNGGGYSLQAFVENIGTTTALGVLNQDFTQYNTNPDYAPGIAEFVQMYQDEYGEPPLSGHSLANYFGAHVLLDTMAEAGSYDLGALEEAALSLDREVGSSATTWGVKFDPDTHQNTRTSVTGHQWQEDNYTDDIWHPERSDGTADLYTVFPEQGRLPEVEVKNIPRPHYEQ